MQMDKRDVWEWGAIKLGFESLPLMVSELVLAM